MNLKWVCKDGGICHIYCGESSICKLSNIVKPFAKKYSFGNNKTDYCTVCDKIMKTDNVIKIKKTIEQINLKIIKFYQKFEIYPSDALLNLITLEDVTLDEIQKLSAKDFGGILPGDILSDAIISKKIHIEDNGIICSSDRGEIL